MKRTTLFAVSVAGFLIAALLVVGCTAPSPGTVKSTTVPTTSLPAVTPDASSCGITTCHGLDLACGANAPQVCTMEYRLGDKCRQYARCDSSGGSCTLITDPQFTACRSCVEQCSAKSGSNGQAAFECEATC